MQAGYFIGQGCNLVLCIQDMKDGISIDNHEVMLSVSLSQSAS